MKRRSPRGDRWTVSYELCCDQHVTGPCTPSTHPREARACVSEQVLETSSVLGPEAVEQALVHVPVELCKSRDQQGHTAYDVISATF